MILKWKQIESKIFELLYISELCILYTVVHEWIMIPLLQCTIKSNYSGMIKFLLTYNGLIFFHFESKVHLNCAGANILRLKPLYWRLFFKSIYYWFFLVQSSFDHLNQDVALNSTYAFTWHCKNPWTRYDFFKLVFYMYLEGH